MGLQRSFIRLSYILCLLLAAAANGCADKPPEPKQTMPIIYSPKFLNIRIEGNRYGEDKPAGRIIREFAAAQSGKIRDANADHIAVELIPLSYAYTFQRPLDLSIEGAQFGVFINYVSGGEVKFLNNEKDLIPIKTIEKALARLCNQLGLKNAAISRGSFWEQKK